MRQASANTGRLLGVDVHQVIGAQLAALGGSCAADVALLLATHDLAQPAPLQCTLAADGILRHFEGSVHSAPGRRPDR